MQPLLTRTVPAIALALSFGQAGEFAQQYLQRLGGAADALRNVVERFDVGAAAAGMTRSEALVRLESNPDVFVARQGSDAAETVREFEAAERRYRKLVTAAPFATVFVIAADPDWRVILRTAADFAPAIPAGAGGLLLTFVGFMLGWLGGTTVEGAVRLVRRRRLRHALAAPASGFHHRPPVL